MDWIFTSMLNFQDVLLRREEYCGVICPYQLANLLTRLFQFYWIKIVAAGLGSLLEPSGITDALINAGVYGQGVAESSVVNVGEYINAKEGMGIIAEAMDYMLYKAFQLSESYTVNMGSLPSEYANRDFEGTTSFVYNGDPTTDFTQC